jgi:ATP-binding cassette subfamily C protein
MIASFTRLLRRCYTLALPYGRLRLFAVLGWILFNGLLQLVGVTSVFPFFALAADPERIRHSKLGIMLLGYLPPMSTNHLLAVAGVVAIVLLVVASIGNMASEVFRIRYAYGFSHWLRGRLLRSYAARPYAFYLERNSSSLNQRVLDIRFFTEELLLPLGEVLTRIILILFLVGAVFLVQPFIALGALVIFGGFYAGSFAWLRPRTRKVSAKLQHHNVEFSRNTTQFLHGIKTVMVHGKSEHFIGKALGHSGEIGNYQSRIPIYGNGPRYLVEPIAFGGLVAIVVVLALQGRPFSDILPNLSVMAFAGYRLLPSLQMMYTQLVKIASNSYTLNQLEEEMFEIEREEAPEVSAGGGAAMEFRRDIVLEGVSFGYAAAPAPILKDFNLTIRKNESVGIAGPSGSGKSTLVDILLGLHRPVSGRLLIDGTPVATENVASWRRLIGYVPQDIYLLDESIAENIAFGLDPSTVDQQALREAARGAQILDFIERELPDGFAARVGERGVRLSGGQRQRIGLARALYHKPEILILDEATSALDHAMEEEVMKTIRALQGRMTMITIAHRLVTLEGCDRIIRMGGDAKP